MNHSFPTKVHQIKLSPNNASTKKTAPRFTSQHRHNTNTK